MEAFPSPEPGGGLRSAGMLWRWYGHCMEVVLIDFLIAPAMRRSLKQRQVKTSPPTTPEAAPRLPHERDESIDSQGSDGPRKDMQQAYDDLEKGLVDTDLRGATPGTEQANRPRDDPPGTLASAQRRSRGTDTKKLPDGK